MAKKAVPAETVQKLLQAVIDVVGFSDQDSDDGSTCAWCGRDLRLADEDDEESEEEDQENCEHKDCRIVELRRQMASIVKSHSVKMPVQMDAKDKYVLPKD